MVTNHSYNLIEGAATLLWWCPKVVSFHAYLTLFPGLPVFCVLWFAFSTKLRGGRMTSVYFSECKLKGKKMGETWE